MHGDKSMNRLDPSCVQEIVPDVFLTSLGVWLLLFRIFDFDRLKFYGLPRWIVGTQAAFGHHENIYLLADFLFQHCYNSFVLKHVRLLLLP